MKFNIDEVSMVVAVTPSVALPDNFIKIVTSINFILRKRIESSEQNSERNWERIFGIKSVNHKDIPSS